MKWLAAIFVLLIVTPAFAVRETPDPHVHGEPMRGSSLVGNPLRPFALHRSIGGSEDICAFGSAVPTPVRAYNFNLNTFFYATGSPAYDKDVWDQSKPSSTRVMTCNDSTTTLGTRCPTHTLVGSDGWVNFLTANLDGGGQKMAFLENDRPAHDFGTGDAFTIYFRISKLVGTNESNYTIMGKEDEWRLRVPAFDTTEICLQITDVNESDNCLTATDRLEYDATHFTPNWTQMAVRWEGSTTKLSTYSSRDAASPQITSGLWTGPMPNTSNILYLGSVELAQNGNFALDDVIIWNVALTDAQMANMIAGNDGNGCRVDTVRTGP